MLHQMLAHRTFCHEIGHVLGYQHAFDIENPSDPVYRDDFCVMGQDNVGSWWMPANAAMDRLEHDPGLTLATHLAAAASSYRHCRPFRTSLGVREVSPTIPEEAELVSLSRATFGDRVLLVVRDAGAFFVVEYRTNVGWDTGVSSAVVVHSLGLREIRPASVKIDQCGSRPRSTHPGPTSIERPVRTGRCRCWQYRRRQDGSN